MNEAWNLFAPPPPGFSVQDAERITTDRILKTVDLAEARMNHQRRIEALNWLASKGPWPGPNPPLGSFKLDPGQGDFEILIAISPDALRNNESEEDGLRSWRYPLYCQWLGEGKIPPAVDVVRHVDGYLNCLNRVRLLSARAMGALWLPAWYSPTDMRGPRPLWQSLRLGEVFVYAASVHKDGWAGVERDYPEVHP